MDGLAPEDREVAPDRGAGRLHGFAVPIRLGFVRRIELRLDFLTSKFVWNKCDRRGCEEVLHAWMPPIKEEKGQRVDAIGERVGCDAGDWFDECVMG